jgi:N-acetylglucosamine-6-sulfatase
LRFFGPLLAVVIAFTAAIPGSSTALQARAADTPRPPNILLITTDDQNVDDLRYMRWTRSLIADKGVAFSDAIAPYPLCCPARATLVTGLFNHNNGVISNQGPHGGYSALRNGEFADETLPTWLNQTRDGHDYETAFIGKFLNGYGRHMDLDGSIEVPSGWDYFAARAAGYGVYQYWGGGFNVLDRSAGGNRAVVETPDAYVTEYIHEKVIERIEHAAGDPSNPADDKPFFIWQSELAPHGTCEARKGGGCRWVPPVPAEQDKDKFPKARLHALRHQAFNERVVSDKPRHIRDRDRWTPRHVNKMSFHHRQRIRSLQAVDRSVRRTITKLKELGQLDNTLILFTSDNGYLLGEHRWRGKTLPYEPSLRVPLVMRGPGVPVGQKVTRTVSLVDVAATIAEVANAEPRLERDGAPLPLDGLSLIDTATGGPGWQISPIEAGDQSGVGRDSWWYRGVRTKRYVYVKYENTGEIELYDLRHDPHQLNNLAYRPTHRQTRRALATKLRLLRNCAGPDCHSVKAGRVPQGVSDGAPIHPDELGSIGDATQVVTLTAKTWRSGRGTAVAWRKFGRTWRIARGPFPVKLGAKGLIRPSRPRHLKNKTPAGTFAPAWTMGFAPDPGAAFRYRKLDGDDYLPFDPTRHATYNVFQPRQPRTPHTAGAAALRFADRRDRYAVAVMMRYNLPGQLYRSQPTGERLARIPADVESGSLFLHVGTRTPGQGWVTMSRPSMRWMIGWMDPTQGTSFVIGTPSYLRNRL